MSLVPESALPAYTFLHVAISLVAIASGFVVAFGMISDRRLVGATALFLFTTLLTSITGFGFPIHGMTPGIAFGILTLLVLPTAMFGLYARRLKGRWRPVYIVGAMFAFYLNFVVLIVQSFQKLSPLQALAPTQSEPPFLVVQITSLIGFLILGILALRRFQNSGLR